MRCKLVSVILLTALVTVVLAVCGCTGNGNAPTPTPTPTPTPVPTISPSPTATPQAVDEIVGTWDGYKNSINYSIQFFSDGTLVYTEDRNQGDGGWKKLGTRQYLIGVMAADSQIIIDNNMTFYWSTKGINFTKTR